MCDKKTSDLGASNNSKENDEDDDIQHIENPEIIINKDDHDNTIKYNHLKPGPVYIISTDNNEIQHVKNIKTHSKDDKKLHNKIFKDSIVDVGAYLRSEFIGLNAQDVQDEQDTTDKIPEYTELDMTGHSRKVGKKSKARKNVQKHTRHYIYSKGTFTVLRIMAGENIPESKVVMIYDPETRNYTVKGMFVITMILHLMTWVFNMLLYLSPTRYGLIEFGHIISIAPFFFLLLTIIIMMCFQCCRRDCCVGCAVFSAFFFTSCAYASFASYYVTRIFGFSGFILFLTNLVCVVMGCQTFDYSSKLMYAIAVGSCAGFLIFFIPILHTFFASYFYFWGFTFEYPAETTLSFLGIIIFTLGSAAIQIAELHLILEGEWIEVGEDDYSFGGFLMFVCLIDYPIRVLRKYGACNSCDKEDDE